MTKLGSVTDYNPSVASQAYGWNPSEVSAKSRSKRLWICSKGHIWEARVDHRTGDGSGCHYCTGYKATPGISDLLTLYPKLSLEVLEEDPSTIAPGSIKQIKWMCPEGHIFKTSPKNRIQGSKCPGCASITSLAPHLIEEIVDKSIDPLTIKAYSKKVLEWCCTEGHNWTAAVYSRVAGNGCSTCAKSCYDPEQSGYLYFLHHELWGMFQIGITNHPKNRLSVHARTGWEIITVRGPMDGVLAKELERDILRFLKEVGADLGNKNIAGKFDGYTETWVEESYPIPSLKNLLEKVT